MSGLRCAYVVSRYPAITHTFIVNEVRALRDRGAEVHPVSIRRSAQEEILGPIAEDEEARTRALLPTSAKLLASVHLRAFARAPLGYVRTFAEALAAGPGGARNRLWQLFYFTESILLWDHLERIGVRHVHVHFANVSSDVALLCTAYGNRATRDGRRWTWSLTVHGPTEILNMDPHKLALKARSADAVACTSDFVRSQLMSLVDSSDWHRLHTVRCGVDVDVFHPPSRPREAERVEILNVAAMSRRKGHAVLLEALAELAARGVDFDVLLVGDGPERDRLEALAGRLGVGGRVRFAGSLAQEELPALYRRADIFCLPSYAEGVPTVLMEAMASELPVVATAVMGVPELVDDGRTGLLVPPARPDALAHALERLARDAELRARMGRAARDCIESDYDLREAALRVHRLLAETASDDGPAGSTAPHRGGAVVQ